MRWFKNLFFNKPFVFVAIFAGLIGVYFYYHDYYSNSPNYSIDNCNDIKALIFDTKDYNSKRAKCHSQRAHAVSDSESCLETNSPASCLANVSITSGNYACDLLDKEELTMCNKKLLKLGGDAVNMLGGLDAYRQDKIVTVKNGEKFLIGPINIVSENTAEIRSDRIARCTRYEYPAIKLSTGLPDASYIFVSGCDIQGDTVLIEYTKYNLEGINYPQGI